MRASTSGALVRAILVCAAAATPSSVAGQVVRSRVRQPASPYTAEYKITQTQRLADGNLINLESKEVVALDSQHRRMTAKTETFVPGSVGLGSRVVVTDPVARTIAIWSSPGQRATVSSMSEPGALRGCFPTATQVEGVSSGVARIL